MVNRTLYDFLEAALVRLARWCSMYLAFVYIKFYYSLCSLRLSRSLLCLGRLFVLTLF